MNRRHFFSAIAVAATAPHWLSAKESVGLKIEAVEIWRLQGKRPIQPGRRWQSNCQPLHIYPEHRPLPYEQQQPGTGGEGTYNANYLFIKTNQGVQGVYGPIDNEAAVVVDRQLKRFLIGKNPLAIEMLWDKMFRLNRHSRAGHYMMGISAVDNALWDLRGRYYDAPVYQLLGGGRDRVEVYGSALGYSVEPKAAAAKAIELKAQGFHRQKWFAFYGPSHGNEGLLKNVALVKAVRDAIGEECDLMIDAFMGWDLNYALSWCPRVEEYRLRWLEEAFHPDKLESFVELNRSTGIPVASGEHFYSRWEVERFLDAGALQVVQADPEWCGGVSELMRIATLASANDVHLIPHGHNIHAALHVVASQSPMTCPLVEYLIDKMSYYYMFEKEQPKPVDGALLLPQRPGFGIDFDESVIEKRQLMSWS